MCLSVCEVSMHCHVLCLLCQGFQESCAET